MINYIKYGFGITIGVLLAKGIISVDGFQERTSDRMR